MEVIDYPVHEQVFRTDNRKVNLMFFGKISIRTDAGVARRKKSRRQLLHARVPRADEQLAYARTLAKLPKERVFSRTTTND